VILILGFGFERRQSIEVQQHCPLDQGSSSDLAFLTDLLYALPDLRVKSYVVALA
jgi:hypothetical protein